MNPRVLFIITGDPRTSPRPAEAVRIAAGLGAARRVDVAVYLRGAAIRTLAESAEGLMDEDNFARYWPLLAETSRLIYVQQHATALREIGQGSVSFAEISDDQLAELAAGQSCVLRF
jgi:hypothetical protein